MQIKHSAMIVTLLLASAHTANANFGLGLGVGFSTEIYHDYDRTILPLPLINYESDSFYFRGLGGGYHVYKDAQNELSLNAYYLPMRFDPDDTDNRAMKLLDKRKSTLMAGVRYQHSADWGIIKAAFSGDTLSNNEGFLADMSYSYPLHLNRTTITAGAGVTWASKKYNQYYFGISEAESARSGLSRYKPDDSWSPYVEMNVNHKFDNHWTASVGGRLTHLSDEVKDSPMVSRTYNTTMFVGVNYQF